MKLELKMHRSIYGYGRPFVNGDERIEPMMNFARSIDCGSLCRLISRYRNGTD